MAWPVLDLLELLLRQIEIDEDRIERLQRDHHRARADKLAGIHRSDAEMARERRSQGLLRDDRLLLGDLSLQRFEIGRRDVKLRLADELALKLGLIASVICLPEIARGLQRMELGDVVGVAQPDDLGTLRDIAAGIEIHLIDDACDFDRKIGAPDRLQRAHDLNRGLPFLEPCRGGGHGRSGRCGKSLFREGVEREI